MLVVQREQHMCGSMNDVNYHLEEEVLSLMCTNQSEEFWSGLLSVSRGKNSLCHLVNPFICIYNYITRYLFLLDMRLCELNQISCYIRIIWWFDQRFLFAFVHFKEVAVQSVQCMQRVQVSVQGRELCVCAWGGIFRRWVMLEDVHRKIIWLELMPLDRMWSNSRTFRDKFHFVLVGMQNESGCCLWVRITWVQSV